MSQRSKKSGSQSNYKWLGSFSIDEAGTTQTSNTINSDPNDQSQNSSDGK